MNNRVSWTQQAIDKINIKQNNSQNNININQNIVPAKTSEELREQIDENPGKIEFYLALANVYRQNKLMTNEITIYE